MVEVPVFPGFLEHYDSLAQVLPLISVRLLPGGQIERPLRVVALKLDRVRLRSPEEHLPDTKIP